MRNTVVKVCIVCLLLIFGQEVSACMCGQMPLTALAEMQDSDAVFVGKVTEIREVKGFSRDGLSYTQGFAIKLKVKKSFKGVKDHEVTINVGNSDCDVHFAKGEEWLVFARLFDNALTTGGCTRTQLARTAVQDLQCLEGGRCIERCSECIEEGNRPPPSSVILKPIQKPK